MSQPQSDLPESDPDPSDPLLDESDPNFAEYKKILDRFKPAEDVSEVRAEECIVIADVRMIRVTMLSYKPKEKFSTAMTMIYQTKSTQKSGRRSSSYRRNNARPRPDCR